MRTTITYTCDRNGNVTKTYSSGNKKSNYTTIDDKPFHERMMRQYYNLECNGTLDTGTRTKSQIKRIWELDGQRAAVGLD